MSDTWGAGVAGRTALVVGASSGIGLSTARRLAEAGARVHGAARRQVRDAPFTSHSVDVMDRAAMQQLIATVGPLDVLLYVAGTNVPNRRLDQVGSDDFDEMVGVNLAGAFYAIKAALPGLRERRGDVLVVASISGQWPDASGPAYQAAKAGVIGLVRACDLEEHAGGVRFSVINPGLVDTPILDKRPVKPPLEVLAQALKPEDVAEACLFMLSLPAHVHVPELSILPGRLQAFGDSNTAHRFPASQGSAPPP